MKVSLLKLSEMTIFRKADFNIQEGGGGGLDNGHPSSRNPKFKTTGYKRKLSLKSGFLKKDIIYIKRRFKQIFTTYV